MSDQARIQRGSFGKWSLVAALAVAVWLWSGTPKSFEDLRKFALNLLIAGVLAVLACTVFQAVFRELMTMEPIAIPKSLEERGYTSAIVLQRTIDHINLVNTTAKTRVTRVPISNEPPYASFADLQLPSSGLSLHTFVSVLREMLGNDQKIGGEIIVARKGATPSSDEHELLLRFDIAPDKSHRFGGSADSRKFVVRVKADAAGKHDGVADIDRLIARAAETIVEHTNPSVLASYLYSARQWGKLDALLDQLVVASRPDMRRDALILRGMRLLEQGKPDEALRFLEDAATQDPPSRFAFIRYGEGLFKAGKPDDAIRQFEQALAQSMRRKPGPLLASGWARALLAKNDVDAALRKLNEVDEDGRRDARILRLRGEVMLWKGDTDAAVEAYRMAVDRDPHDWKSYDGWGVALHQGGDLVGAIEKFDLAGKADDHVPQPHFNKGRVRLDQHDIDGAIEAYRKAAEVDPEYAPAYVEWAECLMRKHDFAGALEKLRIAMKLNPTKNLARTVSELYLILTTREEHPPAVGAPVNSPAVRQVQVSRTD